MLGMRKSTSGRASDRLRVALDQWKIQPVSAQNDSGIFDAPPAQRSYAESPPEAEGPRINWGGWNPRSAKSLAFIVTAVLIVAFGVWFLGRPASLSEVGALTTATQSDSDVTSSERELDAGMTPVAASTELVVHVAGEVKNPGLYRLASGARVADAIAAAGGVSKKKAQDSVNLARLVVDGEQIVVGSGGEGTVAGAGDGAGVGAGDGAGSGANGISINSADASALEGLPGIGPVLAQRIVDHRVANGPFTSIDQLADVSGIGESILGQIRNLATL